MASESGAAISVECIPPVFLREDQEGLTFLTLDLPAIRRAR
jgi:hypothetical protein